MLIILTINKQPTLCKYYSGPPINLKDAKALECPDNGEVYKLWFITDGEEHSAKLDGSLEGEVRLSDFYY